MNYILTKNGITPEILNKTELELFSRAVSHAKSGNLICFEHFAEETNQRLNLQADLRQDIKNQLCALAEIALKALEEASTSAEESVFSSFSKNIDLDGLELRHSRLILGVAELLESCGELIGKCSDAILSADDVRIVEFKLRFIALSEFSENAVLKEKYQILDTYIIRLSRANAVQEFGTYERLTSALSSELKALCEDTDALFEKIKQSNANLTAYNRAVMRCAAAVKNLSASIA